MSYDELLASDDYRAILRSICEEPQSDLPRLVAADWLEEHGHENRAEFIRDQVAGVNRPVPTFVAEQFGGNPNQYDHTLITSGVGASIILYHCRRGFVWSVQVGLGEFCRLAPALFAASPIEHVAISGLYYDRLPAVAGQPQEYVVRMLDGPFPAGSPLESLVARRFTSPARDFPQIVSDLCVEYGRAVSHLWRPGPAGAGGAG